LPNSPIYCDLDPVRFSQVLNNLLVNALKYSPAGGAIDVAVDQDQDQENCAKISVADQGVGISKEDIKYIFEPFRRTPASRSSTPGVGLGLSVARRIAEAHGGTIHVESQLGVGTTFAFKLPTTRRNEVDTAL
jgi:signal transduction histidine kinase